MEFTNFAPISEIDKGIASRGFGSVRHGSDQNLFVKFDLHGVIDAQATEAAGHEVYKDVVYIKIITPGSKDEVHRRANEKDKQRFPREWALFEQSRGDEVAGFRLEHWAAATKAQVQTLKAANCHTVEQLAALGDQALSYLGMGFRKLQTQAKAFLEHAKGEAVTNKLAAENEELKREVERIKNLLMENAGAKETRRGRPKKSKEAEEENEE